MTIQEIEQVISNMHYTISGSQSIGWLIKLDDGRTYDVPIGVKYSVVVTLAKRLTQ